MLVYSGHVLPYKAPLTFDAVEPRIHNTKFKSTLVCFSLKIINYENDIVNNIINMKINIIVLCD